MSQQTLNIPGLGTHRVIGLEVDDGLGLPDVVLEGLGLGQVDGEAVDQEALQRLAAGLDACVRACVGKRERKGRYC